jgi:DNA/RNA endonuclease YhcR with UshA esterase domain
VIPTLLRRLMSGLVVILLSATIASPHHSFSAVYDDKRSVTVSGTVTQFRFVNPHALLYMDVTDDSGTVAKWVVEFAGRLNLSEVGWTAQSVVPGERVTVTGNPTHTPSLQLAFVKLMKADGTVLVPAAAQRADALEEERRERARQRKPPQ